ncbi:MAG: extracellular solute-binding protein, partial [Spirochaetales bacterium]|nr:extracellular solute-binding protein [Spirochaetales bacterium]
MKKLLKILTVLFVFSFMFVSSVSAGGQQDAPAEGPIEITFGFVSGEVKPVDTDEPWFQAIAEKTGVKVKDVVFIGPPYDEKYAVLIGSGDLPDVFLLTTQTLETISTKFAKTGNLFNYKPVFNKEKMPNAYAWYDQPYMKEQVEKYAMDGEGNMWVSPSYYGANPVQTNPLYRKDLFDEAGLVYPTNLDEFYNVLKKMREFYGPDHYPLTAIYGGADALPQLSRWFGIWDTDAAMMYNSEKDVWEYGPMKPGFKEAIAFFTKCYEEGLLDPEFVTSTPDDWNRKLTADQVSMTWFWQVVRENSLNRPERPEFNYSMFPPFTKDGIEKYDYEMGQAVHPQGYAISSKSKYIDKLVGFVDWMYSYEGIAMGYMGLEDVSFEKNPGVTGDFKSVYDLEMPYKWTDNVKTYANPDGTTPPELINSPAFWAPAYFLAVQHGYFFGSNWGDQEGAELKKFVMDNVNLVGPFGKPAFTQAENDERTSIETELKTNMEETALSMIIGKKSLSEWDKFVEI